MKKNNIFICTVLLFISILLPAPVFAGEKLYDILEGIRKKYGQLPGFTVAYEREIISKSRSMLGGQINKRDMAAGRIHFKPPYFLRIQQDKPKPESVITDGDTLWWYIPDKGEVYVYPSHETGRELRLLSDIFQGLKEVGDRFSVGLSDTGKEASTSREGEYLLTLNPTPPWPEIEHIKLSVSAGNSSIRMVEIHDYIGGITRFILGDFSVRDDFQEGFFRFAIPDGVRVIEKD